MGENTKIEWCHDTFNPWVGCEKVSPACKNCYAEGWAKRTGKPNLWKGERRRTSAANWRKPLRWNQTAICKTCGYAEVIGSDDCRNCGNNFSAKNYQRRRVFCASLADVFEDRPELNYWRCDLFALIDQTPNLDWLLLTKRPENINKMVKCLTSKLPDNVWLGTTVENQEQADKRRTHLSEVPAAVRFLSCEPLLGPVDLRNLRSPMGDSARWDALHGNIDWVICGGESGPNARPSHPDWFRSLRDQCVSAGVAFHFKQHGEWLHESQTDKNRWASYCKKTCEVQEVGKHVEFGGYTYKVGKARAGRLLDGREWNELPQR